MATTPAYGLRYRALTDTPDIAAGTQNLAQDVEAQLQRIDSAIAALGPIGAEVATQQTTTSTTFTDLTTVGPAVTFTVPSSGKVEVTVSGQLFNSAGNFTLMGFALSGGNTLAASDSKALLVFGVNAVQAGIPILLTGLTPGSTTFTAKYRVSGGTGTFINRKIHVRPA